MDFTGLKIGNLTAPIPIIQGGMGIGVSSSSLAGAVAKEGGIGIISTAQIGYNEENFESNFLAANLTALKKHIKLAKEKAINGIVGINIMVATNYYAEHVAAAIEAGIDLIISGAGIPLHLPKLVKGTNTKIAPIVSTPKSARVILKAWDVKHNVAPDMIVVEGPKAGGHLGFSTKDLDNIDSIDFEQYVKDIIELKKPYEEKYKKHIPIVPAGGIFNGEDIAKYLRLGADGVQMATRFVATEECDADINFKMAYINSKKEDIAIVKSPVGMPGRAIINKFIKKISSESIKAPKCYNCLIPCNPSTTPYCISNALINAVKGNTDDGLIFCGENAYRLDKITTVKELMKELVNELTLA
ncbi:nitronate monooxygenase [Clostridium bornimense]|uniref:NAD(P)H-dependent flavin oxidoreductase n=1 Tax=Clostridium bornimense TaxID=1216932 RepID=UPI001C123994|nr:nitronate monooxygenase [Clostridium bornimense]MBU5316749.1 nitronate monooxygenase [Clostridium bornimense]